MKFPLETEVIRVLHKHPNLAIALGSDKKIKSALTGIVEAEKQKMVESLKQQTTLKLDSPEELDAHIETSIDTESNCSCENCSCEKSTTTVDKDGKLCE